METYKGYTIEWQKRDGESGRWVVTDERGNVLIRAATHAGAYRAIRDAS